MVRKKLQQQQNKPEHENDIYISQRQKKSVRIAVYVIGVVWNDIINCSTIVHNETETGGSEMKMKIRRKKSALNLKGCQRRTCLGSAKDPPNDAEEWCEFKRKQKKGDLVVCACRFFFFFFSRLTLKIMDRYKRATINKRAVRLSHRWPMELKGKIGNSEFESFWLFVTGSFLSSFNHGNYCVSNDFTIMCLCVCVTSK